MASHLYETTVAAPQRPFLRASVNAVRGPGQTPGIGTAKVGNATIFAKAAGGKIIAGGDSGFKAASAQLNTEAIARSHAAAK